MPSPPEYWSRLGGVSLAVSGILFVAFPVIRPFTDSSPDPLVIAETFASTSWIFAHVLGMVAFTLVPVGLVGLSRCLEKSPGEQPAFWGVVSCWIGVGLALPFFGIEAFSLGGMGARAVAQKAPDLVALAQSIRVGLGVGFFLVELVLVAIVAILIAIALWRSSVLPRWSGVTLGIGLALYIPQFAFSHPIRVAHGVVLGVGSLWLASSMLKLRPKAAGH